MSVRYITALLLITPCFFLSIGWHAVLAAPTTSLMNGYWKLDESTQGSTAIESTGNSLNGTPGGTGGGPSPSTDVPYTTFPNSHSASFNGTDQYLAGGTSAKLTLSTRFTISFWVKLSTNKSEFILGGRKWSSPTDSGSNYAVIYGFTPNMIEFYSQNYTGTSPRTAFNTSISDTNWHHIAWTYFAGTLKGYLDGTLDVSRSVSFTIGTANNNFYIGDSNPNTSNTDWFSGNLDDVRIYKRDLTATEIADLAHGNHTSVTWTGASSTNYESTANWSPAAVPEPYSIVNIPSTNNIPVLITAESAAGMNIASGAVFNLAGFNFAMKDVSATSGLATNSGTIISQNSETLTNFSISTNSGTINYINTTDKTGLNLGNAYYNVLFANGMAGYFPFDGATQGTKISDSAGNGYKLSPFGSGGGPSLSTDVPPIHFTNTQSVSFNGTDQYFTLTRPIQGDFSICSWIKTSTGGPSTPHYQLNPILEAEYPFLAYDFGFGIDSNKKLAYGNGGSSDITINGTAVVADGTWHHVCVTRNSSSGAVVLYVDGTVDTTGTTSTGDMSNNSQARIGDGSDGGGFYNGLMDDLRIYAKTLTASEIASIATGNTPTVAQATTTLNQNITVNGNLILRSGTLDTSSSNYTITLAGNFQNDGGVFAPRTGTVTLNGGNQSIINNNTFYNLIKSTPSANTLTFDQSSTTTVLGTLTLTGANSSNRLSLRSSTLGTAFKIDPQGSRTINNVDVQDSNNINATAIAYDSSNNYGSNLTNWTTSGGVSSSSSNSSSSTSSPSSLSTSNTQTCSTSAPHGVPDLFQIDASETSVTLYFVPVIGADSYFIRYGTDSSANQFATSFSHSDTSGAVPYTISSLSPNTTYYFTVRGGNGCATGDWSKTVSAKTHGSYIASSTSISSEEIKTTPTPKKFSTKTQAKKISNTPTLEATREAEKPSGLNLDVKVLAENNQPVVGANVTLHSKVQFAKTDEKGVAHFANVEKGEHTVLLAYGNYSGSQKLSVDGSKKQEAITMQVQMTDEFSSTIVRIVIVVLTLIIGGLLFFLFFRKK